MKNQSSYALTASQNKLIEGDWFYKENTKGCYEGIAEVIVDEFCSYISDFSDYTKYYLCFEDKYIDWCKSKIFVSKGERVLSLDEILEETDEGTNILESVYDIPYETYYNGILFYLNEVIGLNLRKYIEDIILLDYITRNTDRHLGNISVILTKEGNYRYCPIYDNGRSLMSDTIMFPMGSKIDIWYKKTEYMCKPFVEEFKEQITLVEDNRKLNIDYNGLLNRFNEVQESIKEFVPTDYVSKCIRAIDCLLYSLDCSYGVVWEEI